MGGKKMQDNSEEQKRSLLTLIADFFLGRTWDSQRSALKKEYKLLMKASCSYYKFSREMVMPDFAALLYKIYGTINPLREFFLANNDDASYVPLVVTYYLTAEQQSLLEQFSEERLTASMGSDVFEAVKEHISGLFDTLQDSFEPEQLAVINNVYNAVMQLKQFCTVDYFDMLKHFAPSLTEGTFPSQPRFVPVYKNFVAQQIAGFISSLYTVLQVPDWKEAFGFLAKRPGCKMSNPDRYTQLFAELRQLQQKNVFEALGKLVLHDIAFQPQLYLPDTNAVQAYTDTLSQTVAGALENLYSKHRAEQLNLLAAKLFDGKDVPVLQNYTEAVSQRYTAEGLPGFTKCTELFHVHAFVELYVKTEIVRFMKVFSVRAVSSEQNFVSQLAQEFHDVVEQDTVLVKTEMQLSPKFQQGYKLSVLFQNISSDRTAEVQLRSALKSIDSTFISLVQEQQERLCKFESYFQALLEERTNMASQIVQNWDELDAFFKDPVEDSLRSIYGHLHDFAMLVDCYN